MRWARTPTPVSRRPRPPLLAQAVLCERKRLVLGALRKDELEPTAIEDKTLFVILLVYEKRSDKGLRLCGTTEKASIRKQLQE